MAIVYTHSLDNIVKKEVELLKANNNNNHVTQPAGHVSLDAHQDAVGFLGCKRTLLSHTELFIQKHSQVFLPKAFLNPLPTQPVLVLQMC